MIRWVNMYNRPYPGELQGARGLHADSRDFMKDWKLPPDLKLPPNYIYGCPPGVTPTTTPAVSIGDAGPSPSPELRRPRRHPDPPGAIMGTPSCIPSPVMVAGGNAPPPPTMREINVFPAVGSSRLSSAAPREFSARRHGRQLCGFARFRRNRSWADWSTTS